MAAAAQLSIFALIERGDLAEVQRRVQADPVVMEELRWGWQCTALMWAIRRKQSAIALWLIGHRGGHDVNAQNYYGRAAIHEACQHGLLEILQQLVAAGANAAAASED